MRWTVTGLVTACLLFAGIAYARSHYGSYIPHGNDVLPGNTTTCQTCHVGTQGGSLNAFGVQVKATLKNGVPDWSALFSKDADNDGFTNGYELGDPNGTWQPNSDGPYGTITNPTDGSSYSTEPLAIQRIQVPTTWAVIKALFQ